MTIESIRDQLPESCLVFDQPAFDKSIIGVDTFDCVVYSYTSMVQELVEEDNISEEEAIDFIDYNTVRMLSYMAPENRPIIVYDYLDI